jgi:hypothetical protein
MEVLPFAGSEPFTREAIHKLERKKRREIICEKDPSTQRKQPQVVEDVEALPRHPGEKEDTVGSVTMINGAMPSTLMG